MIAGHPTELCEAPADPSALLAANRRVVQRGNGIRPGTVVRRYSYEAGGLKGLMVQTLDVVTGAFVSESRAGAVRGGHGFDGRTPWLLDLSGFSSPQGGGNTIAAAVNEAYRNANLWWRPGAGGARVTSAGCGGIEIWPAGGQGFRAWFDPRTHLLSRIRESGSYGATVETRFLNYRPVRGMLTAGRVETVTNDNPGSLETMNLTSDIELTEHGASAYSMPTAQPADWTLSAPRVAVPFKIVNNHVIVDVLVNGHGPYPFLLDTGGHDIVTPATVKALAIPSQGASPAGGAGDKTVTTGFARIAELSIGGATLREQSVLTLDFSPLEVEGIRLGGMLGVEFMERFVVRIDYGAKVLTMSDRTASDAVGNDAGTPIPFLLYDHMPQVIGDFDGRPARFDIDTGARGEVTLTSPFVQGAALEDAYHGGTTVTDGWGVGGPAKSYVVRASSLRMNGITVPRPLAGLSLATKGSFSDPNYEGNIGGGLLKRFSVTFDYSKLRMYLRRLDNPDADVGRFDRTGMWINRADLGVEVMDLASGGPAQSAGLRVGDVITAIGGVSTKDASLSEVRRWLKLLPVEHEVAVVYLRASATATVSLRPRDLVPD
jgi:hypothetical protein